ncbi:MAG TPA: pitrilysin family protein [Terriglobales bacterium]|nr:pitrilysin family protein [Terriglobales bacterium]
MKTFKTYFALLLFVLGCTLSGLAQKQTPPAGGPPKPFKVPAHETFTLPNGMKVTLVPYGTTPKVFVAAMVRAGNIDEGSQQTWLADLTTELLREGTKTRSAQDVAGEFASMGGALEMSAMMDQTYVRTDVLSEFGPKAVALIADVLQNPLLPDSELARIKNDLARQLTIAMSQPGPIARNQFAKLLYPNHPYGRLYPTAEMISKYTISDVRKFYGDNFGAARTHLYVAGMFDSAAVKKAITDSFGKWEKGAEPLQLAPQPESKRSLDVVDRPGAAQSTIIMGLPVTDPSSTDYIPLQVMDSLLGGSFGSRITSNIREAKGYTYSPFSAVSPHYRDAYWAETADVTTAVTGPSLKEIFYEIDRLSKEPPSGAELTGIKNYMAGIFVLRNSSRRGIVGQLNYVDLHGRGEDYLNPYVQKIYGVTPQKVQEMAAKYINPGKMTIVVVGDKSKIAEQLTPYQAVSQ